MFQPDTSTNVDFRLCLPNKLREQSNLWTIFPVVPSKTPSARLKKKDQMPVYLKTGVVYLHNRMVFSKTANSEKFNLVKNLENNEQP